MSYSGVQKRLILAISLVSAGVPLLMSGCGSPQKGDAAQFATKSEAADGDKLDAVASESNQLDRLHSTGPSASEPGSSIADSEPLETQTQSEPGGSSVDNAEIASGLSVLLFKNIKTKQNIHTLRSAGGRQLSYWVFGDSGPVTLILGGMHGTEYTPTVLSAQFIEWLEATPDAVVRGRIVVAPLVDPDGFASRKRGNDHGVDLNRNYPAKNWRMRAGRHGLRPLSEPETRFVMELLEKFDPRCIVSIHGPLACVNYDGPAEELARRMSHACGLPVRASVGYATPGSFGSFAGVDRGIPTITLELRPGRALDPDFDACRKALMAAHEFSVEQMPERATD